MTEPVRHDPPSTTICLDEFDVGPTVCVCRLPAGHDPWHECTCGSTWQEVQTRA